MKLVERVWGKEKTYESEKEILFFGYDMVKTLVIGILIAILIALLFQEIKEAVFFLMIFIPLRQNAGGFHAKTRLRCAAISAVIYISVLVIVQYIYLNKWILLCLFVILSAVVAKYAPVENVNNKLDEKEIDIYGKRTKLILGIEDILFMFLFCFDMIKLLFIITVSHAVVVALLIIGIIQNKIYNL